jgi:hypothetical protein
MKLSKVEVSTTDVGFAAFLFTFLEHSWFKIQTDASGNPEVFFRVSALDNWTRYLQDYERSPIVNAQSYWFDIVELQNKVKQCHKSGGILWRS